jgi:carbonic anhydrase
MFLFSKERLKSSIVIMIACALLSFFVVGGEKDKAKPDAAVQTNVQQVGHSHCGAVTGAFKGGEFPENADNVVKSIKENKIVEHMGAKVIGAYYNIESGEVLF